jgi:uncharacterized protein (DUF885 family)
MSTEETFYRKAEDWFSWLLELNPVYATEEGDHRWDDRFSDNTPDALEGQQREMKKALGEFEAIDTGGFNLDARIDHTLVVHLLKSIVRQYDKVQAHRRNPGYYLDQVMSGIFLLIVKDFAPLPERLQSALGRIREVPRVLNEGTENVVAEEVPRVWAEVALEQTTQAPALLAELLPSMASQYAPGLESDLKGAGQKAAEAVQSYQGFLERKVIPQASGDFAVGREVFDEVLREDHMVDYNADQLLETGERLFRETEEQMKAVARKIDPARPVAELLEEAKGDHPSAEELLKAYEAAMQAARQYVIDHQIVTIPEGETLRIIETPVYLRPILPYAAYMPPGILEERQEGHFLVTPVDPHAPAQAQEEKLKGHNRSKLPVTALHEAYPGHHLQLVWANAHKSIPRRMAGFLSSLFIEGWAFYCEELMEQLGYIAEPVQKLGRLTDQLWRAARIILDVSLHTRGMSVEEAVDFLVTKCRLERSNALAEVRRYTSTPTQPQTYLMGKLALLEIVDEYRKAHPNASLSQMHDAILSCGSLPPRLMRQRLLAR